MKILKLISSNVFLRQNGPVLVGALVVGVLNYLFYPVIGRILDPVAFGEVQAIFSLFLQISLFLTVLSVVVVFVVTNYKSVKKRNSTILELEKAAVYSSLALLIIVILFGQWFKDFFKFESAMPFILLAILLVVSVPLTFRTAFMRGRQNFKGSVLANIVTSAGRLLLAPPFVLVGMGASGALIGLVLGQMLALFYAAIVAAKDGLTRTGDIKLWSSPKIKNILPELKYSLLVLAGSLAIMMQLTIDALTVKHLFDAHTAGLYAGVTTVARTIFFLAAPIITALLPAVKIGSDKKINAKHLLKSLILFSAIGLPLLIVMVLFPAQIVVLLMGQQYIEVASLLPLLAVTTFVTSVLNVVVSYFLALKRYISGMIAIIGFAVTLGLIMFRHGSPQAIIESLFVGSMVSMCLIAIWLARERLTSRGSIDETTETIHRGSGLQ